MLQVDKHKSGTLHWCLFSCSLSGISPFAGDTQAETLANVTKAEWSFDEELFADFSSSAKEFVSSLIIKDPR